MSDLLINGMEMPKRGMVVSIHADGRVTRHFDEFGKMIGKAVSVSPHGRLIDADALEEDFNIICSLNCPYPDTKKDCGSCLLNVAFTVLAEAHTVIPAEEE